MAESGMRGRVCKALKQLDAIAVENKALPGTPDVNYLHGWIELKWLRAWPKQGGIVRLEHYTTQQRNRARIRYRRGGVSLLLLQCGREWLMFEPPFSTDIVGHVCRDELYEGALITWNGLKNQDLLNFLSNYRSPSACT